ncbi:MAG TPA: hypothetical protein VIM73_20830 [Polyangiaceae bacterium]
MRELQSYLRVRTEEYGRLPLFAHLRDTGVDARERLAFVPALAHFVMTFADLYALVLRQEPPQDKFQEIVNAHTYEDGGHWKWFLADLAILDQDPTARYSEFLKYVWDDSTRNIRMLSYRICRLGIGADSLSKLVLVQCIEAAGKVSLEAAAPVGREVGSRLGKKLVYFGPHHLDTESDHTLEEADTHSWLESVEIDASRRPQLRHIIDESFEAFTAFSEEVLRVSKGGPALPRIKPHSRET